MSYVGTTRAREVQISLDFECFGRMSTFMRYSWPFGPLTFDQQDRPSMARPEHLCVHRSHQRFHCATKASRARFLQRPLLIQSICRSNATPATPASWPTATLILPIQPSRPALYTSINLVQRGPTSPPHLSQSEPAEDIDARARKKGQEAL